MGEIYFIDRKVSSVSYNERFYRMYSITFNKS